MCSKCVVSVSSENSVCVVCVVLDSFFYNRLQILHRMCVLWHVVGVGKVMLPVVGGRLDFACTSGRCNRQSEFTLLHFTIFH